MSIAQRSTPISLSRRDDMFIRFGSYKHIVRNED